MPVYQYKALKGDGGNEAGVIDADSPKEARLKLRTKGLHVTALSPAGGTSGAQKLAIRLPILRRKHIQDLSLTTRQIATLLNSGIPMMGSLTAVIEQAENKHLKVVMMDIREKVAQGAPLSDTMGQHPYYFNELYVNMIRAGEAAGTLDKVMFRLADYLTTQHRIQSKLSAALTYPIIMVVIGTCVVIFLLTFVVPKITEVIQQQAKAALPLPTEILLTLSHFLGAYWWLLLLMLGVASFLWRRLLKTEQGRLWWDSYKLGIPVLGPLLRKASISRFSVTFATLLESGLPVLDSLNVVKRVVNNQLMTNVLEEVRQKISEGADIATPLKASKVFPPVVGYMIAVGEESGRLEDLLKRISQAYDEEVEVAAQKLTSLLEPAMIVVMAAVVGFIVLAVLLPILQMSNL